MSALKRITLLDTILTLLLITLVAQQTECILVGEGVHNDAEAQKYWNKR